MTNSKEPMIFSIEISPFKSRRPSDYELAKELNDFGFPQQTIFLFYKLKGTDNITMRWAP